MKVRKHEKLENVYWVEFDDGTRRLATVNLTPTVKVYDERLVRAGGTEYRLWDPYRSKLAAALLRGLKGMPIPTGSKVLYLGAASGTTASHVSDVVGPRGVVYCVEISSRPLRDLLTVCGRRSNMVPILADATQLDSYRMVVEQADVVYQDIARPEQAEILLKNSRIFLRRGGYAFLALKARSIDVTKDPQEIFRMEIEKLERELEIVDVRTLDPYSKDHVMLLLGK